MSDSLGRTILTTLTALWKRQQPLPTSNLSGMGRVELDRLGMAGPITEERYLKSYQGVHSASKHEELRMDWPIHRELEGDLKRPRAELTKDTGVAYIGTNFRCY
jgi:hypothetical protein